MSKLLIFHCLDLTGDFNLRMQYIDAVDELLPDTSCPTDLFPCSCWEILVPGIVASGLLHFAEVCKNGLTSKTFVLE